MLGKKVKDIVTGYHGIATARCEYMNGCVQYKIESPADLTTFESKNMWVDIDRVEVIGDGVKFGKTTNGGPSVNMPKPSHP